MPYPNPILPGSNADPSIVKIGHDYYLVTSSFEYLPAMPAVAGRMIGLYATAGTVAFDRFRYRGTET